MFDMRTHPHCSLQRRSFAPAFGTPRRVTAQGPAALRCRGCIKAHRFVVAESGHIFRSPETIILSLMFRTIHLLSQELKGNIRVFCRVRPSADGENAETACELPAGSEGRGEQWQQTCLLLIDFSSLAVALPGIQFAGGIGHNAPCNTAVQRATQRERSETTRCVGILAGLELQLPGDKYNFAFDRVFGPSASQVLLHFGMHYCRSLFLSPALQTCVPAPAHKSAQCDTPFRRQRGLSTEAFAPCCHRFGLLGFLAASWLSVRHLAASMGERVVSFAAGGGLRGDLSAGAVGAGRLPRVHFRLWRNRLRQGG